MQMKLFCLWKLVCHFDLREFVLGFFDFLFVLRSLVQKIRAELIKFIDMQDISLFFEHTSCSKQASVESVMKVAVVTS